MHGPVMGSGELDMELRSAVTLMLPLATTIVRYRRCLRGSGDPARLRALLGAVTAESDKLKSTLSYLDFANGPETLSHSMSMSMFLVDHFNPSDEVEVPAEQWRKYVSQFA